MTDDAGCELSEKARSLDRLGLSVQLDGVCTSLELAEISGRRHDITDETHSMLGILRSTYVDGRGRQQPLLVLTEAAALWAVSKWDDELRARVVVGRPLSPRDR